MWLENHSADWLSKWESVKLHRLRAHTQFGATRIRLNAGRQKKRQQQEKRYAGLCLIWQCGRKHTALGENPEQKCTETCKYEPQDRFGNDAA